jgi:hypothetical protein
MPDFRVRYLSDVLTPPQLNDAISPPGSVQLYTTNINPLKRNSLLKTNPKYRFSMIPVRNN